MKKQLKFLIAVKTVVLVLLVGFFLTVPAMAEEVTLTGQINENYQLVTTDGNIYDIADTAAGSELADYVDKQVTVTGTVEVVDGAKAITVQSYTAQE